MDDVCVFPWLLQETAAAQAEAAVFDASRLADFAEQVIFNRPATTLSPLVREAGRLVRYCPESSPHADPESC